jgi:predicted N-acetyltransferase YhbS
MDIKIIETLNIHYKETENLTREVFWNLFKPGCDEHLVLHQHRKSEDYVKELDLIAKNDSEIIGHVITTKAKVIDEFGNKNEVLCLGPLSVHPNFQKAGIGSMLMEATIEIANKLGFTAILLMGYPEYYQKFGFVNAQQYKITTSDSQNFDAFMALELEPKSLKLVSGKFYYSEAFNVNPHDLENYDKEFPPKQKLRLKNQLV